MGKKMSKLSRLFKSEIIFSLKKKNLYHLPRQKPNFSN